MHKISILICLYQAEQQLPPTLNSLQRLVVPEDFQCELILADNGSTDRTLEIARGFSAPQLRTTVMDFGPIGKCAATNLAIRSMDAEVILFTDQDVEVPTNWIEEMSRPLIDKRLDALGGGVTIAPDLLREWMRPMHKMALADTDGLDPEDPHHLVGANMSCRHDVFNTLSGFDPELGPGPKAGGEDWLFLLQLKAAGFRVGTNFACGVTHNFDPSRLSKDAFMKQCYGRGLGSAYVERHFVHWKPNLLPLRVVGQGVRLWRVRKRIAASGWPDDVPHPDEMDALTKYSMLKHLGAEFRRPANYDKLGVVHRFLSPVLGKGQ